MPRRRLRVLAILAAAALTGCGDGAGDDARLAADSAAVDSLPAPAASGPKACDLIGDAALDSIVGIDLEPARITNDYAGDSGCFWNLPGDPQRGVRIALHAHGDLEKYRRVPGGEAADGPGDAAVWNPTYAQLAVLDGGAVVSISLLIAEPQRADAERIARAALDVLASSRD